MKSAWQAVRLHHMRRLKKYFVDYEPFDVSKKGNSGGGMAYGQGL